MAKAVNGVSANNNESLRRRNGESNRHQLNAWRSLAAAARNGESAMAVMASAKINMAAGIEMAAISAMAIEA